MPNVETNDIMLTWLSIIFEREEDRKYRIQRMILVGYQIIPFIILISIVAFETGGLIGLIADPTEYKPGTIKMLITGWPLIGIVATVCLGMPSECIKDFDYKQQFIRENGRKPKSEEYPKRHAVTDTIIMSLFCTLFVLISNVELDMLESLTAMERLLATVPSALCTLMVMYLLWNARKREQTRARVIVESQTGVE